MVGVVGVGGEITLQDVEITHPFTVSVSPASRMQIKTVFHYTNKYIRHFMEVLLTLPTFSYYIYDASTSLQVAT